MITLRKERIIALGVFVIVVTIFTSWKIDLWESETQIRNEPTLPAPTIEKVVVTPPAPKTTATTTIPQDATRLNNDSEKPASGVGEKPAAAARGHLTTIPEGAHIEGFTLLDNLYLRNGTFYVVTSDVSTFPPLRNMLSRPSKIESGVDLDPTDKEMQFLHVGDLEGTLGKYPLRIDGLSFILYDPPQFMSVCILALAQFISTIGGEK
ncbi:hypothetical protein DXG03_001649 [Asterophora parasitica]|uniref:Uncharacterized protein n=1 Tax=Asterophora parasitica TaxID=117018 RepID=A0A9P7G2V6_9AGAR|nr:hypothetical protein DXG03_001649 [Asterophora parasitica]